MNDNQIKRPESIPVSNTEKQEIKVIIEKIVELIRTKHL
jgi:hypothetical protein